MSNILSTTEFFIRNPVAALLFTLLPEFSRLEKETLIERIHSGLENARRKGTILGRPHGTTRNDAALLKEYASVVRCLKQGFSLRQTATLAGVSVSTVRTIKHAMKTNDAPLHTPTTGGGTTLHFVGMPKGESKKMLSCSTFFYHFLHP